MTTTSPLPEPFARIAGVVRAIAVLPDGNRVVVGGDVPAVPVLDLRTGAVWASLDRPSSTLLAAAATLDDRIVLCGTDDITEWQLGDLSSYGGAVVSGLAAAAVSPAGDLIVGAGSGGLLLWERNYDGRYVRTSGPSAGFPVRVIEINADGDRIVVGGTSPVVTVMDRRGALVRELPGHRPDVVSIAATPSAAWVATLDRARGVRLWSTADARPDPVELTGHSGDVLKVALSSDGSQVVAGGLAGRIWVWQRAKPAEPMELVARLSRLTR